MTGMCRAATKANEAAQALGKLGNAMKAAIPPEMNVVFLSGEANPLKLDANETQSSAAPALLVDNGRTPAGVRCNAGLGPAGERDES